MTQAELALLAGVGRSTVQALEGGKNTVQLDSVVAVADALGCDIALLTRAGSFVPPLDPTLFKHSSYERSMQPMPTREDTFFPIY